MNTTLVRKLIACGAIRQDTVIEVEYGAPSLSCVERKGVTGEFVIKRGVNDLINDRVVFDVVKDETSRRVDASSIFAIDGMDIDRFARTHNLDVYGNDIPVGKKRGRVPKAVKLAALKAA